MPTSENNQSNQRSVYSTGLSSVNWIEAWGRGVERMFSACRAAGLPVPKLRCEPDGMWL